MPNVNVPVPVEPFLQRAGLNAVALPACPFCGGLAARDSVKIEGGSESRYFVRCRACACEGPWAGSVSAADRLWMERVDAARYELRPAEEWIEEFGDCIWWHLPISEPPCIGYGPHFGEWVDGAPTTCARLLAEGWLTHFTRLPDCRKLIATDGARIQP